MDIKEFRNGILDDVHFNASINGTSPREEFLVMYANALVEAEEFEEFEQLAYEGVGSQNKKILIDGYYYNLPFHRQYGCSVPHCNRGRNAL